MEGVEYLDEEDKSFNIIQFILTNYFELNYHTLYVIYYYIDNKMCTRVYKGVNLFKYRGIFRFYGSLWSSVLTIKHEYGSGVIIANVDFVDVGR